MVELSGDGVGDELVDTVLKGFAVREGSPRFGELHLPSNPVQGVPSGILPETLRLDPPLGMAVRAYRGVGSRSVTPPGV